jgi:hypothetical protein
MQSGHDWHDRHSTKCAHNEALACAVTSLPQCSKRAMPRRHVQMNAARLHVTASLAADLNGTVTSQHGVQMSAVAALAVLRILSDQDTKLLTADFIQIGIKF